jgi:perosamine synthetase
LKVKAGDEVIIPSYTCAALLHAVNYVKARPVLVDTEKNGFNIDPDQVKARCSGRTRAIIVPHTFGFPAEITAISALGIPVIEDCAQALGSSVGGLPAGKTGTIGVFSFYASKMIAAGQGGMIVTDDESIFSTVDDLIHHDQRPDYKVRYNYQSTDLIAALARSQLKKLDLFLSRRRLLVLKYRKILKANKNIILYRDKPGIISNNYRFIIRFPDAESRNLAQLKFKDKKITTIIPIAGYQLLHNLLGQNHNLYPNSERLAETALSIPVFPCLSAEQTDRICQVLNYL